MKHYEKLKNIRKAQNLTIEELYNRGITILGPQKAISISTINRIEAGKPHKFSSLLKLCFILGIELKELYKGTEREECLVITKKDRTGGYIYNNKASSQIINSPNQQFLVLEVTLLPSGNLPLDHALDSVEKHEKVIYVVRGQLDCVVNNQRYILKGGETISFNSSQLHYFENTTKKKCVFTMTENPGRY